MIMDHYKYCPMCKTPLKWGDLEGRQRLYCGKCGWIKYCNPVPVAVCLVTNKKKELLLIKRGIDPCKGRWALPGGFVELDETIQEAGQRELHEETGLTGKAGRLIGLHMQKSRMYGYVLVAGIEFIIKNENITVGDDAADAKFFPGKKLPNIPFSSHHKLIEDYYR